MTSRHDQRVAHMPGVDVENRDGRVVGVDLLGGQVARDEGVNLLRERIEALRGDRPVILTGDFNSEPGSSVVAHVQKDGVLHDVKQVAARKSGTEWSFSDFGQIPEAERPLLDYIFVSDGIAADLYEVLPDTLGGGYVSDHAPVMAIVKFEK